MTIVLRLTKKIHSDILDHTLAYVDPLDYALVQMEWYYTSGGKITMSQQYRIARQLFGALAAARDDRHSARAGRGRCRRTEPIKRTFRSEPGARTP